MPWWGMVRHGWSFGAGCGNQTSPAYPASWPLSRARTTASRLAILPRAVLTRKAPRFILAIIWSLKRSRVPGWSGADGYDVADLDHVFDAGVKGEAEFLFDAFGEAMLVEIVELDVEGLEAL